MYRENNANVITNVKTGHGGWERFELVITFGPDTGGTIFGTYDLFFERLDANNSEGILARTQLANDVAVNAGGFTNGVGHMRVVFSMNPYTNPNDENDTGDSIVYWDNISVDVSPVPEPTSLGLLGLGLLTATRRRRNR